MQMSTPESADARSDPQSTFHGAADLPLATAATPRLPGYQVHHKLGQGGMGEVYLARQEKLQRLVAIKRIAGGALAGPEMLAHLRGEAEALARLHHPHIVQVHDVAEHLGEPYLV